MSNCGIAASSQDIRTMIEAVHVLDRQAGRGYPDGCSETRKWKNSKFYVRHEVRKKKDH